MPSFRVTGRCHSLNPLKIGKFESRRLAVREEMSDDRTEFDFYHRSEEEQASLLLHTWCDHCQAADLGMVQPVEYEQFGLRFVEGKCKSCGQAVFTELSDDEF